MQKWELKSEVASGGGSLDMSLNRASHDGWELVTVLSPGQGIYRLFFKRLYVAPKKKMQVPVQVKGKRK